MLMYWRLLCEPIVHFVHFGNLHIFVENENDSDFVVLFISCDRNGVLIDGFEALAGSFVRLLFFFSS